MYISEGKGLILPPGFQNRIALSGDELKIEILSFDPEDRNVIVRYPDGYERHHQCDTIIKLMDKVSGQLRARYNVESFEIKAIPASLSGTIILGGIKYA